MGGFELSTKFPKRRCLAGSLSVVAGKDRGDFFQMGVGVQFLNKKKTEI